MVVPCSAMVLACPNSTSASRRPALSMRPMLLSVWAARYVGEPVRAILRRIQNDLFDIGADLCRPERSGLKVEPLRLQETQVTWLEAMIDEHNAGLGPLTSFVLPGGSEASALLHIARTITRRAEREIAELAFQEPVTPAVIRYMNRLSDLLFVLARFENDSGRGDVLWHPGEHRDPASPPAG